MALIEYKDVRITRQEQTILKNVNITVEEKDFVFLLGRVGSGKSTFLKSL
jgi:cell division transport system ATP-binding protein